MDDVNSPDVSKIRGSSDERELPHQVSPEDTSNWKNRVIALPGPNRSEAQFIMADPSDIQLVPKIKNPYLTQERLASVKRKK